MKADVDRNIGAIDTVSKRLNCSVRQMHFSVVGLAIDGAAVLLGSCNN